MKEYEEEVSVSCINCFVTFWVLPGEEGDQDYCVFCENNKDVIEKDHLRLLRIITVLPYSEARFMPDILELMCRVFSHNDPRFKDIRRNFDNDEIYEEKK